MRIPGSDESTDVFVETIPYFAKCGHDCLRPTENLTNCVQRKANEILTVNSVGRSECFFLAALLVTVCIAVAVARVITDPDMDLRCDLKVAGAFITEEKNPTNRTSLTQDYLLGENADVQGPQD